jgi:hypothetical protein
VQQQSQQHMIVLALQAPGNWFAASSHCKVVHVLCTITCRCVSTERPCSEGRISTQVMFPFDSTVGDPKRSTCSNKKHAKAIAS